MAEVGVDRERLDRLAARVETSSSELAREAGWLLGVAQNLTDERGRLRAELDLAIRQIVMQTQAHARYVETIRGRYEEVVRDRDVARESCVQLVETFARVTAERIDCARCDRAQCLTSCAADERLAKVRALVEHARKISPADRMNIAAADLEEALQ